MVCSHSWLRAGIPLLGRSRRLQGHGSCSVFPFCPYWIGVWLPQSSSSVWIAFLNWPPKSQVWVWHRKERLAQTHTSPSLQQKDQIGLQDPTAAQASLPPPLKFLQFSPLNSHCWVPSVNAIPQWRVGALFPRQHSFPFWHQPQIFSGKPPFPILPPYGL